MSNVQRKINSKIGHIYLVASEKGLKGVFWNSQQASSENKQTEIETKILDNTQNQLNEYFEGKRKDFNLQLDVNGTEFQNKVWAQLSNIPYGETRSYKQIAMAINSEDASRAVGTANGKNPLCIIIPCHRVIPSDGSIGGYSGGSNAKESLLLLESKHLGK